MTEIDTLVVGASISGLAAAACLNKVNLDYIIIEKQSQVAMPWRKHYDRLHLHTNKRISHLPYKKFPPGVPRYPSRQQVVDYLEDYRREFNINPVFNNGAKSISKEGGYWITKTSTEIYKSRFIIMATGAFGKPKILNCKGLKSFTGSVIHSCDYTSGREYKAQKVLVVGFGNSACEIAVDLYEYGAFPSISVRSPVNIIPRDIFGIPILEISLILNKLPARVADSVSWPLLRLSSGDLDLVGLQKKNYGPFEEIERDGTTPVLDAGIVKHLRAGHIQLCGAMDYIDGSTIVFSDGRRNTFDAIVAGIGYYKDSANMVEVEKDRFADLKFNINKQKYFGKEGLYFCGFWIGPTGQIREIGLDALKIARHISRNKVW